MARKEVESAVKQFNEVGDSVSGILLKVEDGKYGNKAYTLATEEGDIVVFGTTILDSKMAHQSIKIGAKVYITYQGEKPNTNPKLSDIKLWKVEFDE